MWGIIKKAINSNLSLPLNKQFGRLTKGTGKVVPVFNTNVPDIGRFAEVAQYKSVYAVRASPDGLYLYISMSDDEVRKIDLSTFTMGNALITHTNYTMALAISPDGAYVFSGSRDETVKQLITSDDSAGWTFTDNAGEIDRLMVSPDSLYVYSVSWGDSSVRQIVISDGSAGWVHTGSGRVSGGVVSNDGNYLYVYSLLEEGVVQLSTIDGNKVKTVYAGGGNPYALSPDDNSLYCGSYQILRKIDISTGTLEWDNTDFTDTVTSIVISNCGNYVYAGGDGKYIRQVNTLDGVEIWNVYNSTYLYGLAISPNDEKVYSCSRNKSETRSGTREYVNLFHQIKYYEEVT